MVNWDVDVFFRMYMEQFMDMCIEEVELYWIKVIVEVLNVQQKGDLVCFLLLFCQLSEMGYIMNVDYELRV